MQAPSPRAVRRVLDPADLLPARAAEGVQLRTLAEPDGRDACATYLLRLEPGASWSAPQDQALELLLVDGHARLGEHDLAPRDYAHRPLGVPPLTSDTGCTAFVKLAPAFPAGAEPVLVQDADQPWLPGQGGLTVKPLAAYGTCGAAFVHWPAGERFLPHRHMGGEEILVLSGTFEDEHGRYPAGTWIQSPHGSTHHPFVREETVIFVKTGHLPPA